MGIQMMLVVPMKPISFTAGESRCKYHEMTAGGAQWLSGYHVFLASWHVQSNHGQMNQII